MAAAAKIASGHNPFELSPSLQLTVAGPQYVTPLPVAWMLQPLLHASPGVQLIVVLIALQASLAVFLWTALRALGVRGWQMPLLLVLVSIAFEPTMANIDEGQVNLVLLALSGIWLLGWMRGDRWWAGAALGAGVAIKLLQAPLALLVLWGRRWRMLSATVVTWLALFDWGIRRRDWLVVGLVGAGWMLIGPAHNWFQTLLVSGYPNLLVLRLMAEFGVIGITAIWAAGLLAVSRQGSTDRADAAHEHGADREQHDRAREHHPVAEVG